MDSGVNVAAAKGFCKACGLKEGTESLSDKESTYSIKQSTSSPEMSFHESEEDEELDGEEEDEEDAYLEVID